MLRVRFQQQNVKRRTNWIGTVEQLERRELLTVAPASSDIDSILISQYGSALFGADWEAAVGLTADQIHSVIEQGKFSQLINGDQNAFINQFRDYMVSHDGRAVFEKWVEGHVSDAGLPELDASQVSWFQEPVLSYEPTPNPSFSALLDATSGGAFASALLPLSTSPNDSADEPVAIPMADPEHGGTVDLSPTSEDVIEGVDLSADFKVTWNATQGDGFSVKFRTVAGSATPGVDFTPRSGTISFADGSEGDFQTISVPILVDGDLNESPESFHVELYDVEKTQADGVEGVPSLGSSDATVTIYDPDVPPPPPIDPPPPVDPPPPPEPPTIRISDQRVTQQNDEYMRFTVSLSEPSDSAVTVHFATQDDTATAGQDYDGSSGDVTFDPNETIKTLSIHILDNGGIEPDENFFVNLSGPSGATLATQKGVGTIHNDATGKSPSDNPVPDPDCDCGCGCPTLPALANPTQAANAPVIPATQSVPNPDTTPTISPLNGNVSIKQATTSWQDSGETALNYQSNSVSPEPIISVDAITPLPTNSNSMIYSAVATLQYGGITAPSTYYQYSSFGNWSQLPPANLNFSAQVNAASLPSGTYDWTMSVEIHYRVPGQSSDDSVHYLVYHGQQSQINRTSSPYGSGWWPQGLDQLAISGGNVTYISGDGYAAYYAYDSGSSSFATPAGWFNGLSHSNGHYSLKSPTNTIETFDDFGKLLSKTDSLGNTTSYLYDNTTGAVTSITDGIVTHAFSYDTSGHLGSISRKVGPTNPTASITSVSVSSDDKLSALDSPSGSGGQLHTSFTYYTQSSAQHGLLGSITSSTGAVTSYQYDVYRRATGYKHDIDNSVHQASNLESANLALIGGGGNAAAAPVPLVVGVTNANIVDEDGHARRVTVNKQGLVTSVDDGFGVTQYVRDANGRVTKVIYPDPDGNGPQQRPVDSFTYDANGNTLTASHGTVSSPNLTSESWTYDATTQLPLSHTDVMSHLTTYLYDPTYKTLTSVTEHMTDGHGDLVTSYTYTHDFSNSLPNGLLLTEIDPMGHATTYTYSIDPTSAAWAQLSAISQGVSNPRSMQVGYDSATGNVISITDFLGQTTSYQYDNLNQLTQITQPAPAAGQSAPGWHFGYTNGTLTSVTDPRGNTTNYGRDNRGNLNQVTLPGQIVSSSVFDAAHMLTQSTDAEGNVTTYAYDGRGLLSLVTLPVQKIPDSTALASQIRYTYDGLGRLTVKSVIQNNKPVNGSPMPPTVISTKYSYDDLQRVSKVTSGSESQTFTYYDSGQVKDVTDSLGRKTIYMYDDVGRLAQVTEPAPSVETSPYVTSYRYDKNGNLAQVDTPTGSTVYFYDQFDRVHEIAEPQSNNNDQRPTTLFAYDANDNLTLLTDPDGSTTTWTYDHLGQLSTESRLGSSTTRSYSYDPNGNVTSYTDYDGRRTTYDYDPLNQLTAEHWISSSVGGAPLRTISYTYDDVGRLTEATDLTAISIDEFAYDGLGQVYAAREYTKPTAASPDTASVHMTNIAYYDGFGNRTLLGLLRGGSLDSINTYSYDQNNRLTSISQGNPNAGSSVVSKQVSFGYDSEGDVLSLDRQVDLQHTGTMVSSATSTFGYDPAGRLTSLNTVNSAQASLLNQSWTYDASNRIHTYTSSIDGTTTYSYDKLDQLTGATGAVTSSFTFDQAGNRTSAGGQSYTNSPGNRIASDGTYNYLYDAEGNLIQRLLISDSTQYRLYSYDYRNRLVSVREMSDGSAIPTQEVNYRYDALNRLIARTVVLSADTDEGITTVFAHDGSNVSLEYQAIGTGVPTLKTRYLNGPAVDQVFAQEDANQPLISVTRVEWLIADNEGTTRHLVDEGGAVASHYTYDPFGQIVSGDTTATNRLYTGAFFDIAVGLQYNQNRWYSPSLGRWINQDPINFAGGDYNLSRYVTNSPTNFVDSSGLFPGGWFGEGVAQGVLNIINGLQDIAIGVANDILVPPHIRPLRDLGVPYPEIPASPDWSKDAVVPNDPLHDASKFIGGNCAAFLISGQVGKRLSGGSLTAGEHAEAQAIADKFNATVDVVGSRAAGKGRNISKCDLPVGKGRGTRSDIDFRIDPLHPQAEALIEALKGVGNGAGRAGLEWGSRPTFPPFIRFNPRPK